MPAHKATSTRERYDQTLQYARDWRLPADAPRPLPSAHWPDENIALLERYENWLLEGGVSEMVTRIYHVPMVGHVLGLNLKPHAQLDLDKDLDCALAYVQAKGLSQSWLKNCRLALVKFRGFMRLERGLGAESQARPFDPEPLTSGLPAWLVNELKRYQHLRQRNWRTARIEENIRRFWSGYLRTWRFLVETCAVQQLADLKRQHILDYIDHRLEQGYAVSGVNGDLRGLHIFLLFLQDEGYAVPQSLLRVPGLKQPEPLPKYLTDEQVRKVRDEIERSVQEAKLGSHRRLALLVRATFYLLWQCGLRISEVEELRLEDLDLPQKRLSVRDGKGRKDRTVYLTETSIQALRTFLAVRGETVPDRASHGEHVFLYRNVPLKKDLIRSQLKCAGEAGFLLLCARLPGGHRQPAGRDERP